MRFPDEGAGPPHASAVVYAITKLHPEEPGAKYLSSVVEGVRGQGADWRGSRWGFREGRLLLSSLAFGWPLGMT